MKELLEKWSQLEPHLCRKDWLDNYNIELGDGTFFVVESDMTIKHMVLAWIQWAIQQAIIEKGWLFKLEYNPNSPDSDNPYDAAVESGRGFGNNNITEALLIAYLEVLEAHANP